MEAIHFFSEDIDFALPAPGETAAWLGEVIGQEGYSLTQLNIIFCSDEYLHAYNLTYLQHDTLTDVLSFDHSDASGMLEGDIYISIERVQFYLCHSSSNIFFRRPIATASMPLQRGMVCVKALFLTHQGLVRWAMVIIAQ